MILEKYPLKKIKTDIKQIKIPSAESLWQFNLKLLSYLIYFISCSTQWDKLTERKKSASFYVFSKSTINFIASKSELKVEYQIGLEITGCNNI